MEGMATLRMAKESKGAHLHDRNFLFSFPFLYLSFANLFSFVSFFFIIFLLYYDNHYP